jgi:hypothetical protein
MTTFPISFDRPSSMLFAVLRLGRDDARIEVEDLEITVKMGWAFDTVIPRATVASVRALDRRVISRGVHGWRGDWLVNGAGNGLVRIDLEPRVRGRVSLVPVRIASVTVSVEDPPALVDAIESIRVPID